MHRSGQRGRSWTSAVGLAAVVACGWGCHSSQPPSGRSAQEPASSPAAEAGAAAPCVRVGGAIKEPRKTRHAALVIPDSVEKTGMSPGELVYDATIDPAGNVRDLKLRDPSRLGGPWSEVDQAARTAISTWRYEPTLVDGKPVSVCMTINVRAEAW